MRQRCWWRTLALSASFAFTGGISAAQAQELYGESYAAPAPVSADSSSAELRQILARLEQQERELNSLRSLVNQGTPAREASLSAEAADEKAAADGPCKKVEIVSKPAFSVFGRFFFDHIMFEDDPALVAATGVDRLNETGFNTVRLGAKGTIYENLSGQIEVEFEGSEVDYKDVYVDILNAPALGTIRLGHFKEPFGLEELTSSRNITFMQRSLGHSAFVPSRNFGVQASNMIMENENWSWFAGAFRHDSPDNPTARASHIADDGDWVFTGRLAGLLYYDEPSQGRYLVHVGAAYSARNDLTVVSFAQRPELGSQAGYLTSTHTGDDNWNLAGIETAVVWGPGSVQAEYYNADSDSFDANTGGYVEASYFITGENRAYNRAAKAFDRVKPLEDFFRVDTADGVCMGKGAWQLKARYSWVDLEAGATGIRGNMSGMSAGANWYWNPYTRMMFDYVHEDVNLLTGVDGANDNFGMRFQFDF
jgi:phosphate-selective porin OprO/OprP